MKDDLRVAALIEPTDDVSGSDGKGVAYGDALLPVHHHVILRPSGEPDGIRHRHAMLDHPLHDRCPNLSRPMVPGRYRRLQARAQIGRYGVGPTTVWHAEHMKNIQARGNRNLAPRGAVIFKVLVLSRLTFAPAYKVRCPPMFLSLPERHGRANITL